MYRSLAAETDEIISIHVTGKLSGTCQSARLAAETIADRVKVYVVDSEAGSAGLGWMLLEAAHLIEQGLSADQIIKHLEAKRNRISIYFAVDNLQYAQLSGRVGRMSAALGTLLNIKPIIGLTDGFINITDRVRSKTAATRRIVALTKEKVGDQPVNVGIIHALAMEQAEQLMPIVQDSLQVEDCYIKDLAISLAVHFGPGTVGLVAYPVN
jgi:DegV family protein with EDD domain